MRRSLLVAISSLVLIVSNSSAQLVTDNIFLQGRYLEAAIAPNGSWGNTVDFPAGYHTNAGAFASYTDPVLGTTPTGNVSDFSYDVGHDGWATGTPAGFGFFGPYFMPGTPFDGWCMQVNGARSDAWYTNSGFWNAIPGTSTLTGSVSSYQHINGTTGCMGTTQGRMLGVWSGTAGVGGGLKITQTNRVDTLASWLVVTTVFKNTTAAVMNGLYYWVSADPDNDEVVTGGSFPTNNRIYKQNDVDHRSLVWARPPSINQTAFSSLSTKDCRAKVLIYTNWASYPSEATGNTLDQVYAGTATGWLGTCWYGLGNMTLDQDIAYGMVYNLGNLAPGDSTFISYAWGFSDSTVVDSAFPEPLLYVNCLPITPTGPAPAPTVDTFNACLYPGLTTLPVGIKFGDDKCWSWSSWNWSPAVGLSSTTGVTNNITISALPPVITYTITGTFAADAQTCNTRTMYLTILTCNGATCNSPCLGDSLKFNAPGDSTGATYVWYGPAPSTTTVATTQSFTISPSTWADTGTYHVIKTVGTIHDTAVTVAVIHPYPNAIATSTTPICTAIGDTLKLLSIVDIPVSSYSWTGPASFVSSVASPVVPGFGSVTSGTYTVVVASAYGCKDTAYYTASICPTVNLPCLGDTLKFGAPGNPAGVTYTWYGPAPSTAVVSTSQNWQIFPSIWADTGTYHLIRTVGGISDTTSVVAYIHPRPIMNISSNAPLCIGLADTLRLGVTPGTPGEIYHWSGPNAFTSTLEFPTVTGYSPADTGVYKVVAVNSFGCKDSATTDAGIVPPPQAPLISGILEYCYGATPVPFTVVGSNIKWYPSDTATVGWTTTYTPVPTTVPGSYTYFATQTTGCESPKDSITVVVDSQIVPNFTYWIHHGCVQDTVVFTNLSGTYPTSYLWDFGDGTTSNSVSPTHIYVTQSAPTFSVTLTAHNSICSKSISKFPDTRHTVQASFNAVPDTICSGTPATMVNTSSATVAGVTVSPATINSFQWSFGDGNNSTLLSPSDTFAQQNVYTVNLVVTDTIGCTSTASEQVYVLGIKIKSWHDTTLCLPYPLPMDNHVVLLPTGVGISQSYYYTFSWVNSAGLSATNVEVPFFNAFGTYVYTLTATLWGDAGAPLGDGGCVTRDTMTVHSVGSTPVSNITPTTTIMYGQSIQLNSDSELYYWWKPNNGSLDNPNINNPVATPSVTTTYTIYGMNVYGCVDSQFVTIIVDSTMNEFIPSAFTPNGDGLNDVFHPVGLKFQNIVDFRVFNRWGQLVFNTNSAKNGWDGTFNGIPQDMGTYNYLIIVARPGGEGQDMIYKGTVELIR